jgi:hypothetical protein
MPFKPFTDVRDVPFDGDWAELAARWQRAVERDGVSEFEIARLRSRVRSNVKDSGHFSSWATRFGAAAASILVGGICLGTLIYGSGQLVTVDMRDPVAVARAANGSVLIQFQDGRVTHRISTGDDPRAWDQVQVARGLRFVDRSATPQPGNALFYRID